MLVVFLLGGGSSYGAFALSLIATLSARFGFLQKRLMIVFRSFYRFGGYARGVAALAALSRKNDKRYVLIKAEGVSYLSVKRRVLMSKLRGVVGVIVFQGRIYLEARRFKRRRYGSIATRRTAAERARTIGSADQIVRGYAEYAHPFLAAERKCVVLVLQKNVALLREFARQLLCGFLCVFQRIIVGVILSGVQ